MIFLAAIISGVLLWVVGTIIDHFERAQWDREFYARWGEERRPKKR